MQPSSFVRVLAAAAVFGCGSPLVAQTAAPASHWEVVAVRSGIHQNPSPVEGVVWRELITLGHGTPWLRLWFSRIWLGKGSYLRIVSVLDGSVQTLHMEHVEQWQWSSAYFNGNSVMIEIVAGPGTNKNYVEIDKVMAGDTAVPGPDSICGTTDDRVPSAHPAAGRIDPIGCSGWLIDVPAAGIDKLHLSAGHCFSSGVLEFDVPASNANCAIVHPPANKQFAIDHGSSMYVNGGPGNDYWVYRCFANSTTGLTTFQTQGATYPLAATIPGVGTTLRNYGYGLDGTNTNNATGNSCSCPGGSGQRNQVQQTHTGPLNGVAGNRLDYGFDTCGGNSGSVVIDNGTGLAVAIHTHGGCTSGGGSNSGTAITHPNLQAAIAAMAGGTGGAVPNDDCATAIAVVDGINGPYSNSGAATSFAFPCGNATTGRDVWYRYVATCSGGTTFDTCSATRTFDTVLEVFGGSCGGLASLGCNDDSCALGSSLTVTLTAGATYFVRVGGYGGAQGAFDLTVTSCNSADECIGAIPLRLGGNGPFSNAAATTSAPGPMCGALGKDLWFVYQAPPATNVLFTTCNAGTDFDTVIEVFAGSCGSLAWLGCNDDDFGCAHGIRRSTLTVTTGAAATTLYARVGGFASLSGTFVLDVGQSPANDECITAVTVGNGVSGPFSNLNANTSAGWPCALGGADVWFVYTASCTGTLLVDTCSPARTYDTALEIFGGACGSLVSLGCNDDACGLGSSLAVPVVQGQNYWIRMGGYFGSQGQAELSIACIVQGDDCATARPIQDGVNGPFTTVGSTTSLPAFGCGFNVQWDVWFVYTATASVPVTFWTCTPTRTFDTVLEVFTGPCTNLVAVGCNDDYCGLGSRVTINATQGATYWLRVGGWNGGYGAFDVEVQPGTGTGSIVRQVHGCGPTTIACSGQPRIGGAVTTTLGNLAGVPFFGFGFGAGSPFCGCTIGHEWAVALFGSVHVLAVPLDASMIGVTIKVQGADFFGIGGCPSPLLTFTDTMVITIG